MLLLISGLFFFSCSCLVPSPPIVTNCPLQSIPTFVLLQWSTGTSPLKAWTSTKAVSSVGDCPSQNSPGAHGPWPTGAGASSQVLQAPLPVLRSVCLLPDVQRGPIALGSLGVWCWIPQLPQRHFCSWMDAEFLLLRSVLCCCDADVTLPLHLPLLRS